LGEVPAQGEMLPVQGEVQPGMEAQPLSPDAQIQVSAGEEMPTSVEGQPLQAQYIDGDTITIGDNGQTAEVLASNSETGILTVKVSETGDVQEVHESKVTKIGDLTLENTNQLTTQIQELILETKKRKASENNDPHFVQFLTESKRKAWYDLVPADKEKVTFAINESKTEIYSETQLLNAINEALAPKTTFEETLVSKMPSSLKPIWENLDAKYKVSVISQAKLYPNLNNDLKIEKFWESRNLEMYSSINETKQVLNENRVVDNTSLSDDQIDAFISKLKNLDR